MAQRSGARVVKVSDEHVGALAQFFREVWDQNATEASVHAARRLEAAGNPANPGEEPPTYLFLRDGRAIGHLGTIPARLWTVRGPLTAHWLKGFWVLPEFRGGPVGPLLVKAAIGGLETLLSLAVAPAARRVLTGLGFSDLGALTDYARPIRSRRLLQGLAHSSEAEGASPTSHRTGRLLRIPGAVAVSSRALDLGTTLVATAFGRPPSRVFATEAGPEFVEEGDRAWEAAAQAPLIGSLRDGRYLKRRFSDPACYLPLIARQGADAPVGLAVLRRPREGGHVRLGGGRIASIVDIVFPPGDPGIGLRLLHASLERARALDAEALLCGASHPALRRLLLRTGFLPAGARVHLLVRERGEALLPRKVASWWLTRGDGGADDDL